uniref:Uncharacterized protein n=1 Tax=Micrurus spixii TaxID=129469 RepID=A0A2D4LV52_9SAUR
MLKYVMQEKRARIRWKMLQESKNNRRFELLYWELYYQASILTWVKEWINLKHRRLLLLTGHDLQLGWHAFLWYEKNKIHRCFQRHYVRNAQLSVWEKVKGKNSI